MYSTNILLELLLEKNFDDFIFAISGLRINFNVLISVL